MFICVAADCKNEGLREGLNFYKFTKEENLKQQWVINEITQNIQSIKHSRMCHAYCFGSHPRSEKMPFQLALNKNFSAQPNNPSRTDD